MVLKAKQVYNLIFNFTGKALVKAESVIAIYLIPVVVAVSQDDHLLSNNIF
jgi:hypothetical protein